MFENECPMEAKSHWGAAYEAKPPDAVSWYAPHLTGCRPSSIDRPCSSPARATSSFHHHARYIMKIVFLSLSVLVAALSLPASAGAGAADVQRQAEVAKLGADVMPFSLKATTHVFTRATDGGTQRVVAKNAADAQQVKLVREHLREIRAQFLKGDYSGPSHIHGADMPGLAELQAAKPGQVSIDYKDVKAGAELTYRTADTKLVAALHRWFDAQLSDHGTDATAGHMHHDHGAMKKQ